MITLTINDREVSVYGTATILEAAASVGIKIPTLCYFKGLDSFGGCRMCLVEIERVPRLQTACTVRVTEGMVVRTESEAITVARRAMLEFLLINHPLDCPVCDKAGECGLQDLVAIYGAHEGRFLEGKRTHPENFNDPFIVRNMDRCILCTRCTRMCDGPQGAYAIAVTGRGSHSFIEPFSGGRYNCEYCGNCFTVCPVGAIMSRLHRHSYRPWYVEREVETVCGFCGVGCTMVLQMRGGSIIRTMPYVGEGAATGSYGSATQAYGSAGSAAPAQGLNKGLLCVRGRFGYDYLENNERLETPLIRKKGILEPVTWDEALSYVASALKDVKARHGAKSIGAIASGRCTNEDNYMLQKLMRFAIGTNNIDSSARFYYAPAENYLERIFGHGVTANLIPGIENADGVFVAGGDPTAINPILGLQVRALWRKRGKIIVVGTPGGLRRFVNYEIKPHPYLEEVVLEAIVFRLAAKKGFRGENGIIERYIKATAMPGGESLKKANVSKEIVESAAEDLAMMKSAVVIIGPELIERPRASKNLFLVCAIAYLTDARIFLLSERPNYQGAIDMGCAPDILPGGKPIEADALQHKIKDADLPGHKMKDTASTKVPGLKGLDLFAMIDAALAGNLKALYVMGENPVFNFPDRQKIENALSKIDFLVVHDIFMTETARRADVVLPGAAWTEKDGTFTNLERRLQRVRSGIMAGGGAGSYHRDSGADKRPEWKTLAGIGRLMGMKEKYLTSSDVWEEVISVSTLHTGLSYDRIAGGNTIWPYGSEPFRGVEGEFEVEALGSTPVLDDGKIYLLQERQLYHSGSITRKSRALLSISCGAHVLLNTGFAEKRGLKDGDKVIVTTETGRLTLPVKTDREIPENVAYVPNNFDNVSPLGIIGYSVDAYLGSVSLSGNVVSITKADGSSDVAVGEGIL